MDELFNEPEEVKVERVREQYVPVGKNLQKLRLKTVAAAAPAAVDTDTLSNFKAKYDYIKEVYPEGDRNFIANILTALKKENASYNLDLQYTLANLVPEFIPFTQAGRLVKDMKTYIQSGSITSPLELARAVATTSTSMKEASDKVRSVIGERDRLKGQVDILLAAGLAARDAAAARSPETIAAYKAARKLLEDTNLKYKKAYNFGYILRFIFF
jgi:hypothetical protein